MNDLLSKEVVLRCLGMAMECEDCPRKDCKDTKLNAVEVCSIISYLATYADVQPVDRWISVEDELPDINTPVIGCDRSNGVGEMVLMKNGRWYRNGMSWSADAIIYWQPLPEPPKPTE